jgi:flagellar basal-body rod modification protein FlgD
MTTTISSSAAASLTASQSGSKQTIAGNFDTFLQLLTTQLQNQNPMDPLDTNQFTAQLVQFSSVEQQLKTNDLLTTLVSANAANIVSASAGYLGAEITADGSVTALADGKATWALNAAKPAAKATFSVIDPSTGATVYSVTRSLDAGAGSFVWDGRSNDGSLLTAGSYQLKVDATDAAGQPVAVSTEISGKVDAVDLSGDTPLLKIGDISVSLDKVKTLRKSTS